MSGGFEGVDDVGALDGAGGGEVLHLSRLAGGDGAAVSEGEVGEFEDLFAACQGVQVPFGCAFGRVIPVLLAGCEGGIEGVWNVFCGA